MRRLQYLARCMELFSPRAVQNAVSKCITSGIPLPEVHRGVAGVCNQLEHSVHLRRDTAQCYVTLSGTQSGIVTEVVALNAVLNLR